jgi:hypothetical protein
MLRVHDHQVQALKELIDNPAITRLSKYTNGKFISDSLGTVES